jgi:hypothetical protein
MSASAVVTDVTYPAALIAPLMRSESTVFLEQPRDKM